MTTESQKIMFNSDIEMVETVGGWMPKYSDDYDSLLNVLNENSTGQADIDTFTAYDFSDGSRIIEKYNENQEKVFNHYI